MTTQDIKQNIKRHETCIEILEGINHYKRMISHRWDSINGFPGEFPSLRAKYVHDVDIYQRCIARLSSRFNSMMNQIKIQP
jgi:hypothetical protein